MVPCYPCSGLKMANGIEAKDGLVFVVASLEPAIHVYRRTGLSLAMEYKIATRGACDNLVWGPTPVHEPAHADPCTCAANLRCRKLSLACLWLVRRWRQPPHRMPPSSSDICQVQQGAADECSSLRGLEIWRRAEPVTTRSARYDLSDLDRHDALPRCYWR